MIFVYAILTAEYASPVGNTDEIFIMAQTLLCTLGAGLDRNFVIAASTYQNYAWLWLKSVSLYQNNNTELSFSQLVYDDPLGQLRLQL